MSVKAIQILLGSVFIVLGGWCAISPGTVLDLAFTPQYRSHDPIVPILIAAFGAQALIAGTFALFATFTATTFIAYAAVLLPFFAFDYWFYAVEPMLTGMGMLDALGNTAMLALCWLGWRAAKREGIAPQSRPNAGTGWIKLRVPAILLVVAAVLATDFFAVTPLIGRAHALVGQPLTPHSAAGVARRTTRRVVRRSTTYVAALPAGCVRTSVAGTAVWRCGSAYYQAAGGRYVVVYVD